MLKKGGFEQLKDTFSRMALRQFLSHVSHRPFLVRGFKARPSCAVYSKAGLCCCSASALGEASRTGAGTGLGGYKGADSRTAAHAATALAAWSTGPVVLLPEPPALYQGHPRAVDLR